MMASAGAEHASLLLAHRSVLARRVMEEHLQRHPQLAHGHRDVWLRCEEDTSDHLRHLAAAIETQRPALFDGYVRWTADALHAYGLRIVDLKAHFRVLVEVLETEVDARLGAEVRTLVDGAFERLAPRRDEPASFLEPDHPSGRLARDYLAALLEGERSTGVAMVLDAVEQGMPIETLYLDVLQPALREVGRLWQLGRVSVAQEHLVTAATQLAMSTLYPRIAATPRDGRSVLVACIGAELHELGARMVADVFELHGWVVHFVGANTPTATLVEAARARRVEVIALSATLTAHVPRVSEVVKEARSGTDAIVLVGGRAFLGVPDLWEVTHADGTAPDAVTAVTLARELVGAA